MEVAEDGLRLFTCAESVGHSQLNAWGSWKRIPHCSVSVFGDAPGVGEHAKRFGFRSIPSVKRNPFGRPLLDWIFARMHDESTEGVLGYVNSDIVMLPGLAESIAAARARFDRYLLVARRWNVDRLPAIDFRPGWDEKVRSLVARDGALFTPYGIDLFVFSRGLLREIPPFGLGSDYWDNYLVMRARRAGCPVIDVTQQVMLVHQNHSLGKYRSTNERRRSPEGLQAFVLAGDSHALLGQTHDATHVMALGELMPAETARVTVVLPHRGEPRRLCRCLRGLEHQTYPQSFLNAIVINTDPEAPLRYLEADFPSARVINEAWTGPAAARNKGISCANGDVVALFDSDVMPAIDCLERAMRMMTAQPDCQIVACRVDPAFLAGRTGYMQRAVEWFDAAMHYNHKGWTNASGSFITGALLVRKDVFATTGYFSAPCSDAAIDDVEWARRAIAAGIEVAFCRDASVRHETVRTLADLRRKEQRHARGACVLALLEHDTYGVKDVLRDEWRELRARVRTIWDSTRIPRRYRAGVLSIALWSSIWTASAKLQYRHAAQRVVRRHRRAMDRAVQPSVNPRARRAALPLRWLSARAMSRRIANHD